MSDDLDLKSIFIDECDELLSDISECLSELEGDLTNTGAVHSVFRAVHSIKGSAGAFMMEDVVRFAHTFETALETVRNGECQLDADKITVLQRAGDCLAAALEAEFAGTTHNPAFSEEMAEALKQSFELSEAVEEDIEFTAMPLQFGNLDDPVEAEEGETAGEPAEIPPLEDLPAPPDLAAEPDDEPAMVFSSVQTSAPKEQLTPDPATPEPVLPEVPEPVAAPAPVQAPQAPPPPPAGNKETAERAGKAARPTLRVDADRIDLLINTVGELIINQSTILERLKSSDHQADPAIDIALDEYRQLTNDLQERVLAIRAQPVKPLFQRMSRVVREVSNTSGKPARLVMVGEDTEVDKTLVESLAEPLTHMIRNSVDHGLESVDDRRAQGKSETGIVELAAYHSSGNIIVEISDDGAGLNRTKIRDIAVKKGLVAADAELSTAEIDRLLFMPGFSTAEKVSDLSGRGVGMDVVKTAINRLGGTISTHSVTGQGTKFKVAVPLTLAVMDGMIVKVGQETMVLPISCVVETVKCTGQMIEEYGRTKRVIRFRDEYLPIVSIAEAMQLPQANRATSEPALLVIVKLMDEHLIAFELDGVLDRRQLVIKGLENNCGHVRGVSAAAILGDGKLVMIIDPDAVVNVKAESATPIPELAMESESIHVG